MVTNTATYKKGEKGGPKTLIRIDVIIKVKSLKDIKFDPLQFFGFTTYDHKYL